MVIEMTTFRLIDSADRTAFLEADHRFQSEVVPRQPGFLRRTTARGTDGEWCVVTLWASMADAESSAASARAHTRTAELFAHVDAASIEVRRYESID